MSLRLASTTLARWLWSLLPVLVHYSMWCEPCVWYETVLDVCSTVLDASTQRSPASCLRIYGVRRRLFAVEYTCCLSARPPASLSCWSLAYRVRAPDLLESAAKVGASISCGDLEVSILVVVLETPNLSVGNERGYRPRAWTRLPRNVTGGVVTVGLTSGGVRVVHE